MKKIIFILIPFLLFFTTGCWDYIELNNLAIVSGIGIDYEEEKFKLIYEIINDEQGIQNSYLIKGEGKTYIEAIQDIASKSTKSLYFRHLKAIVLGENITKSEFQKTIDYELRQPNFNNTFYSVVVKNGTAKEIYEINNDEIPVIANSIVELLKSAEKDQGIATSYVFDEILSSALDYGLEMTLPTIEKNEDQVKLSGLGVFKGFTLQGYLDISETLTFNLLKNNLKNILYAKSCDNSNQIVISLDQGKSKIRAKENKIEINLNLTSEIRENNCSYDLWNEKSYLEITEKFNQLIRENIQNLIEKTKELDSDILGFGNIYYKKFRNKQNELWKNLDIEIIVDLKINRQDLINEGLK